MTTTAIAPGGASMTSASLAVARRTLRKVVRTPQIMVVGTIQGAMFLLIFRYVFGGAINPGGSVPYVDFLIPGYVATSVLFSGAMTAAGVAEDLDQGFIDRLRSLPIPRASVLAGRAIADTIGLTWSLLGTIAIGFAVGFRLHGSTLGGLAALGLCVVYSFAFSWLFVLLGLVAGNAQAAQGMSMMVFPLTFVSSAYVPSTSMPGWLQVFANNQPITPMVDSVRALALGQSTGGAIVRSLLWSLGLVVVFAPLAVARFKRA